MGAPTVRKHQDSQIYKFLQKKIFKIIYNFSLIYLNFYKTTSYFLTIFVKPVFFFFFFFFFGKFHEITTNFFKLSESEQFRTKFHEANIIWGREHQGYQIYKLLFKKIFLLEKNFPSMHNFSEIISKFFHNLPTVFVQSLDKKFPTSIQKIYLQSSLHYMYIIPFKILIWGCKTQFSKHYSFSQKWLWSPKNDFS